MTEQLDNLYKEINHPINKDALKNGIQLKASAHYIDVIRGDCIVRVNLRHFVYLGDIINSFDYYFNAVVCTPYNSGKQLVDYSKPCWHDVRGFEVMPVFFPAFAEPLQTTTQYLEFAKLSPGSVVLDLGAYSGLTSIIFKRAVGHQGLVIAIEADSTNFDSVKRNINLYETIVGYRGGIRLVKGAIWSHSNGLNFSSESNMGSSASTILGNHRGVVDFVPSYTLSDISKDLNNVDFMKVDIEGAEIEVLRDSEFILRFLPKIIVETHMVGNQMSTQAVLDLLEPLGYHCILCTQDGVELPLLHCSPPSA